MEGHELCPRQPTAACGGVVIWGPQTERNGALTELPATHTHPDTHPDTVDSMWLVSWGKGMVAQKLQIKMRWQK